MTIPTVRIDWGNVIQKKLYTEAVQTKYLFTKYTTPTAADSEEVTKMRLEVIGDQFSERIHLIADLGRHIFCKVSRPILKKTRKHWQICC
jgi:hypothetical protein